jgi:hypothetical protein
MQDYKDVLQYLRGLAIVLNDDTLKVVLNTVSFIYNKAIDDIWDDMYR